MVFPTICVGQSVLEPKFRLECDAVPFSIESDLALPLSEGKVRVVNPTLSAYLNATGYSTRISMECVGNDSKKCLNLNNNIFCKSPKESFSVRSLGSENQTLMIENRCDGGYKKFVRIENSVDYEDTLIFMEERMSFKMKNQIHNTGDFESFKQPLVLLTRSSDGTAEFELQGFRQEHWSGDQPLISTLSLGLTVEQLELSEHEKYTLATGCSIL